MGHQRLGAIVPRAGEIVLGVHLVLRLGAPQLRQQVLLLDAPLGSLDSQFTDLVRALGLLQCAPALPDLEIDLVPALGEGPSRPLLGDQGGTVGIPLRLAVQRRIDGDRVTG